MAKSKIVGIGLAVLGISLAPFFVSQGNQHNTDQISNVEIADMPSDLPTPTQLPTPTFIPSPQRPSMKPPTTGGPIPGTPDAGGNTGGGLTTSLPRPGVPDPTSSRSRRP